MKSNGLVGKILLNNAPVFRRIPFLGRELPTESPWTVVWFDAGADWLYFSARVQFDQTGPQIVEDVYHWPEIIRNANVSMLSRTFSLRVAGPSGIRPNCPTGQPAPSLTYNFTSLWTQYACPVPSHSRSQSY